MLCLVLRTPYQQPPPFLPPYACKVKEGEEFGPGSELATIETDKATVSMEATDDGFVAKILVPEGTPDIDIGKLPTIL